MPPIPFPMPPLIFTAVKDICKINTFEKLPHILFDEVYCQHFDFATRLFSATTTDLFLYDVLQFFSADHSYFAFFPSPLVARSNSLQSVPLPLRLTWSHLRLKIPVQPLKFVCQSRFCECFSTQPMKELNSTVLCFTCNRQSDESLSPLLSRTNKGYTSCMYVKATRCCSAELFIP